MKKYLLGLLCFSLIGCEQIHNLFSKQKKEETSFPPTAVGVLISGTANPFFAEAYQSFQNYGKAIPELTVLAADAENNQEIQFTELDKMLNEGVQAIIINMVDVKQADKVIEKLRSREIPVVFYNRSPAQNVLFSYDKAVFLDGDAVQGGVLQGLDVLQQWKQHPEWDKNKDGVIQFAMLTGIEGNPSAIARTKWSIGTMSSYPELAHKTQQIALESASFRANIANEITRSWIEQGLIQDIEVILANNDTMAIGALEALKQAGIKKPVFGIDATPQALALLKSGELAGTVLNDAKTQAEVALQVVANLAHNHRATEGIDYKMEYQTILIPYHLIDNK
ncbi:galactose ABC transporter substrate-binding protein [Suttonella ornithocola]|uniref:D-galactose/methyl-galactoside binding periplasmic protein MglB n=1 Tax=Suttonella ornithocola TaxID=279832 RepID=A0A380MR79_9GAMM|nr:galactose ABC transporter substrate-binding protein [Suttonella ornithocola]SUO95085.1 D-galactose/ D-glucose-binding protein [Suttonella ornithocola]